MEKEVPQGETAKYLGIYLDKRLTWRTHIFAKKNSWGWNSNKCIGF